MAQSSPLFIQLDGGKAVLYKPDVRPEPHVGIVVMRSESNYLNVACGEFAKRGFIILAF